MIDKQLKLSALKRRYQTQIAVSVCLALSNAALVILTAYVVLHRRIEVTPFVGQGRYSNSDMVVDVNYLMLMAENFVMTRFNVSPENVREKHQQLLKAVTDNAYPRFRRILLKEEHEVIKRQISSQFGIHHMKPDLAAHEVRVSGRVDRFAGQQALPPLERTYILRYRYQWGALKLEYFGKEQAVGTEDTVGNTG